MNTCCIFLRFIPSSAIPIAATGCHTLGFTPRPVILIHCSPHMCSPLSFYSKGVYNDPDCHSDFAYLDHAVLAVGYATEEAADRGTPGRSYFVIKNSWSPHW